VIAAMTILLNRMEGPKSHRRSDGWCHQYAVTLLCGPGAETFCSPAPLRCCCAGGSWRGRSIRPGRRRTWGSPPTRAMTDSERSNSARGNWRSRMKTGRAFTIEPLPRATHRTVRLTASGVKGISAPVPSGVAGRDRRAVGHAPQTLGRRLRPSCGVIGRRPLLLLPAGGGSVEAVGRLTPLPSSRVRHRGTRAPPAGDLAPRAA
jgi:hypothetical protein